MNEMNLYRVAGHGQVEPAHDSPQADGIESVLVLASDPERALDLARQYDAGVIGADNLAWGGQTICAVVEPA